MLYVCVCVLLWVFSIHAVFMKIYQRSVYAFFRGEVCPLSSLLVSENVGSFVLHPCIFAQPLDYIFVSVSRHGSGHDTSEAGELKAQVT